MTVALSLLTAYLLGVITMAAYVLHRVARRGVAPTMRRKRELERDPDFWDIAQDTEPRRVAYRFLGMTGFEE
jgi:hypothetical protein